MKSLRGLYFFLFLVLAYFARVVFIPLFLSIFCAILLEPVTAAIVRRNVSRQVASALTIALFVTVSATVVWLSYASFSSIAINADAIRESLAPVIEWVKTASSKLDLPAPPGALIGSTVDQIQKVQIVEKYPFWTGYLITGAGSIFEVISVTLFVPLLIFYILYEKENLLESFNAFAGRYCYLPNFNSELPKMIRAFAVANILTVLILFFAHGALLYVMGFENWLAMALITAFASLLPLVGGPLAILIPFTQGLSHLHGPFPIILLASGFFAFHFISSNVILPLLIGSKINVNTTSLIFGLLFWGWLWGAMGFLLAIPMTALTKILLESSPETLVFANLMASKPRLLLNGRFMRKQA